jgi:hypothetical protein
MIVNFLKRTEGMDVYDTHTNFNPFSKEKPGETDIAVIAGTESMAVAGQD